MTSRCFLAAGHAKVRVSLLLALCLVVAAQAAELAIEVDASAAPAGSCSVSIDAELESKQVCGILPECVCTDMRSALATGEALASAGNSTLDIVVEIGANATSVEFDNESWTGIQMDVAEGQYSGPPNLNLTATLDVSISASSGHVNVTGLPGSTFLQLFGGSLSLANVTLRSFTVKNSVSVGGNLTLSDVTFAGCGTGSFADDAAIVLVANSSSALRARNIFIEATVSSVLIHFEGKAVDIIGLTAVAASATSIGKFVVEETAVINNVVLAGGYVADLPEDMGRLLAVTFPHGLHGCTGEFRSWSLHGINTDSALMIEDASFRYYQDELPEVLIDDWTVSRSSLGTVVDAFAVNFTVTDVLVNDFTATYFMSLIDCVAHYHNLTMDDMHITAGIYVGSSTFVTMRDCTILEGSAGRGWIYQSTSSLSAVLLEEVVITGSGHPVNVVDTAIKISNCTFLHLDAPFRKRMARTSVAYTFSMTDSTIRALGSTLMDVAGSTLLQNDIFVCAGPGVLNLAADGTESESVVTESSFFNTAIVSSKASLTVSECTFRNALSTIDGSSSVNSILLTGTMQRVTLSACDFIGSNSQSVFVSSIPLSQLPSPVVSFPFRNFSLSIDGCTFRHCIGYEGGALASRDSDVSITESSFKNCTAGSGGAIFSQGGHLAVSHSTFEHCAATDSGGAIHASSGAALVISASNVTRCHAGSFGGGLALSDRVRARVSDSNFRLNDAQSGGAFVLSGRSGLDARASLFETNFASSSGGALYCTDSTSPYVEGCTFMGNSAQGNGGAVMLAGITYAVLKGSSLTGNIANISGGAVYVQDTASPLLTALIISRNQAGVVGGGMVFAMGSTPTVSGCVLSDNHAETSGGGVAVLDKASPVFSNSTFQQNKASSGGGMSTTASSFTTMEGCHFLDNRAFAFAGGILCGDFARLALFGSTLNGNSAFATDSGGGAIGVIQVAQANLTSCVLTGNEAQSNGGAVYQSSMGTSYIVGTVFSDNQARRQGGGLYAADAGGASIDNCTFSRNSALQYGGAISVFELPILVILETHFTANLATLQGAGMNVAGSVSFLMSRSHFQDNWVEPSEGSGGGAYLDSNVVPTWDFVSFTNNSAPSGEGGGLVAKNHAGGFRHLSFFGNHAALGGAMLLRFDSSLYPTTSRIMSNALFSENWSIGNGGALALLVSGDDVENISGSMLPLANCTFVGNMADGSGGGAFASLSDFSAILFEDASFHDNYARELGGGMFVAVGDGLPLLSSSTFFNNSADWGGCNIGFRLVYDPVMVQSSTCVGCTLQVPAQASGYNDAFGYATCDADCPVDIKLDSPPFNMSIGILDAFRTPVVGNLLDVEQYVITLEDAGVNCTVFQSNSFQPVLPKSGQAVFSNFSLAGQQGGTCRFSFSSQPTRTNIGSVALSRTTLKCTVPLSGCMDGEEVVHGDPYDSCQPIKESGNAVLIILVTLISCLFLLVLVLFVSILVMKYRDVRKRAEEEYYANLEIDDELMAPGALTLFDVLNDPEINRIPWAEMVMGDKIGQGASGIVTSAVWRSEKEGLDRDVALKELALRPEDLDQQDIEDFLVEIKLMSALRHPNVVRFLGVSYHENRLYLVTELMEYGSMSSVLSKKGSNLSWSLKMKLVMDTARGMRYLHGKKLIHRDLKPQNVLVSNQWVSKVADFGVSRVTTATATMTVVGTPVYMAPEVLNNERYSEKADVYSFGILLVQVFTGRRPYSEYTMNDAQLMFKIYHDDLRPDTSALPLPLQQLAEEAVHQDPGYRPSFEEIILRLKRIRKLQLGDDGTASGLDTVRSRHASQAQLSVADDTEEQMAPLHDTAGSIND